MPMIVDELAANGLAAQIDALGGPLAGAMRSEPLTIGTSGRVTLPAGYWEPMVQIAPRVDLGADRLTVSASLSGTPAVPLAPVVFEPWSERGHWITLHVPAPLTNRRNPTLLEYELSARLGGTATNLTRLRELVEVRVVEGTVARLLHLMSSEQARLRRQIRLIHAAATLEGARGFMLDRYGQELGVPRLSDRLVVRRGEIVTEAAPEDDAAYRRRLAIYRPWFGASRSAVLALLNGAPGAPGPLQAIGGPATLAIVERDNPLISAIRIISIDTTLSGATIQRRNFLAYLRGTILIDPVGNVPADRKLPQSARSRENALRLRLRGGLNFADANSRAMAPLLAAAFDRLVRVLRVCGVTSQITVVRAQQDEGGGRYELGLGAEIQTLPSATLDAVRTAVAGTLPAARGTEEAAILTAIRNAGSLAATDGKWLFAACGFSTVEATTAGRAYVSHLRIGQLGIDGPSDLALSTLPQTGQVYGARFGDTSGAPGLALAHALGGGSAGWPSGDPPWSLVAPAQLAACLDTLAALDAPTAAATAPSGVAVIAAADIARFVTAAKRFPPGSLAAVRLNATFAGNLAAGDATATARGSRLIESLGNNGAASAALFAGAGSDRILLLSSHGLPLVGANIGPRRSASYFWHCLPVSEGAAASCRPSGTETAVRPTAPGIYALHCLGTGRIGDTDPFEYRVDLPASELIDLSQYEMLMNMLTRCYPVGIEVNTWSLRRSHIDLGDGRPTPLTPRQSRSFRRWQRPHFAGVDLTSRR